MLNLSRGQWLPQLRLHGRLLRLDLLLSLSERASTDASTCSKAQS